MSSGKKPKKVTAPTVTSQYSGVNQAEFGSDFGTGFSQKTTNPDGTASLNTTTKLADFLQPIPELAGRGAQDNLSYLQRTPQQQYEDATGGNNPLYNILTEQTRRNTDGALGRALVNSQGTGTSNSTTAGAAQGMIFNDALMRSNTDLLNAVNFSNETSRANLGANLNALGSMANLVYPLGSAANANLMQAMGQQDAVAMQNANNQLQANIANTQAANQAAMARQQSLGQMIGGGIGMLGTLGGSYLLGGGRGGGVGNPPFIPTGGGGGNVLAPASGGYLAGGYSPMRISDPNFTNLSIM